MANAANQAVSREPVIYVWPHLSSDEVTVYSTALHADGTLSCICPAWKMAKKDKWTGEPKPRTCKHVQQHLPAEYQPLLELYRADKPLPPRRFLVAKNQGHVVNIASSSPVSSPTNDQRMYVEDDTDA